MFWSRTIHDSLIIAERNLLRIRRVPELVVFVTVQPVLFVLLFGYVFGSSIAIPGMNYREYLIGGMFVQSVAFGGALTGIGFAQDRDSGMIRRMHSLPIARSAVLAGRITADLVTIAVTITVVAGTGLLVGWQLHTTVIRAMAAGGILLMFGGAMCGLSAVIGTLSRSAEIAQGIGFVWMFPFVFISNVYVRPKQMVYLLAIFARWNPISLVTTAVRQLLGNMPGNADGPAHAVVIAVLCSFTLLILCLPIGARLASRH